MAKYLTEVNLTEESIKQWKESGEFKQQVLESALEGLIQSLKSKEVNLFNSYLDEENKVLELWTDELTLGEEQKMDRLSLNNEYVKQVIK